MRKLFYCLTGCLIGCLVINLALEVGPVSRGLCAATCTTSWIYPVEDPYIEQEADIPKENWNPGHRGIDLTLEVEGSIIAPADGVISWVGGTGTVPTFRITHDGEIYTTYLPAETDLSIGTRVHQGEVIGYGVKVDDFECFDCLHFGMYTKFNGKPHYLDPEAEIEGYKRIVLVE